ncbi:DUF3185 family protein [Paraburkholderia hayleyella]|uniref:DUF3185 family protein n=1 Tax=Paraburkholderia hayleyella TaxID=2152889 RepID=UPI0012920BF2|nr:DUF3185 family protein [Paraburkholderia hayleyella]
MMKVLSFALIAVGVVLLYFGGQSFQSFSSDVSRVVNGTPTDRTMLLLGAGAVATLLGLTGLAWPRRR